MKNKTTEFRLELITKVDEDKVWHVSYAVMLVQSEDIFEGTVTSYKRIGILLDSCDGLCIAWDDSDRYDHPANLYNATELILQKIGELTNDK